MSRVGQLDSVAICPECGAVVGWMSRDMLDEAEEFTATIQVWTEAGLKLEQATTEESRRRLEIFHREECTKGGIE